MKNPLVIMAAASTLLLVAGLSPGQPPRQSPDKRAGQDLREEGRLQVGDAAPDFTLKTLDGKKSVKLSSFQGKKPVALVFGSYT